MSMQTVGFSAEYNRDNSGPSQLAKFMSQAQTEQDWNDRCDWVKLIHDGDYPGFWFVTIMIGGVAAAAQARWR